MTLILIIIGLILGGGMGGIGGALVGALAGWACGAWIKAADRATRKPSADKLDKALTAVGWTLRLARACARAERGASVMPASAAATMARPQQAARNNLPWKRLRRFHLRSWRFRRRIPCLCIRPPVPHNRHRP